ncbi:MAG TPA: FAD-dependent monooxygenase [Ktedonobacteraceae bacterium]|nr:FAD-dependent monooxygenase [Ktedonobacteraceae bacterium]
MHTETIPVLIVGGGPAGLSASLFLARHGVRSILVERHAHTSVHPRAKGVNTRTLEIFRPLGLEDAIREAGAALTRSTNWLFVETLAGTEHRRLSRRSLFELPADLEQISPTTWALCAQNQLEALLVETAHQRHCDLRFGNELVSFVQDPSGVTACVRATTADTQHQIRADYLIAADGASSPVCKQLAIPMLGRGPLSYSMNIYFRADLRELVQDRWFIMCFVQNPAVQGILAAVNNRDLWQFHVQYDPANGASPQDFTPARCIELVRQAVGLPQLSVEILSVLPWEANVRVAAAFQRDRIFLIGDAAHVMPPAGAFGMNTSIQDAHNLAWKLAAVLNGPAAPSLLSTYESERRPVAQFTTEQAALRFGNQGMPEQTSKNIARVDDTVVILGYRYPSPAIIAEEGTVPPAAQLDLSGRPGTRAPHLWLEKQGQRLSTLDLFDTHFVLLTDQQGQAWYESAQTIATSLKMRLDAYRIGLDSADLIDREGRWHDAYHIVPGGAVLIRPDGFVCWRARAQEAPSQSLLETVLQRLLGN